MARRSPRRALAEAHRSRLRWDQAIDEQCVQGLSRGQFSPSSPKSNVASCGRMLPRPRTLLLVPLDRLAEADLEGDRRGETKPQSCCGRIQGATRLTVRLGHIPMDLAPVTSEIYH